jgi:hypothetical protein
LNAALDLGYSVTDLFEVSFSQNFQWIIIFLKIDHKTFMCVFSLGLGLSRMGLFGGGKSAVCGIHEHFFAH